MTLTLLITSSSLSLAPPPCQTHQYYPLLALLFILHLLTHVQLIHRKIMHETVSHPYLISLRFSSTIRIPQSLNKPLPHPPLSSSTPFTRALIHRWIMDGQKKTFICQGSFSLTVFLLQDGCSANAGQHALEMSPETSHSVCLSVCCLGVLALLTNTFRLFLFPTGHWEALSISFSVKQIFTITPFYIELSQQTFGILSFLYSLFVAFFAACSLDPVSLWPWIGNPILVLTCFPPQKYPLKSHQKTNVWILAFQGSFKKQNLQETRKNT